MGAAGTGDILMAGNVWNSPWWATYPPVARARMMAMSSSMRRPRPAHGSPTTS